MAKEIYCFANQKGGCGKSTSCLSVFDELTRKGFKCLLLDADPQANTSYSIGANLTGTSIADFLQGAPAEECIQHTQRGDVIPAPEQSERLAAADISYNALFEALKPIEKMYDYVLIDTAPSLGLLTLSALRASTSVIIPAEANEYSLQGIGRMTTVTFPSVREENPSLKVAGILITKYNARATYSKAYKNHLEELAKMMNTKVFNTKIRVCVALQEAETKKQSIFEYSPRCNGSIDYAAFTDELIKG